VAMSADGSSAACCSPIPAAIARTQTGRKPIFPLACLCALAASFVLDAEKPTMGVELCPLKAACGLPCPGCGVTRSMIHCSRGDIAGAIRCHPLGPGVWVAALISVSSMMWPRRFRRAVSSWWRRRREAFDRAIIGGTLLLALFGLLRVLFLYLPAPRWWQW